MNMTHLPNERSSNEGEKMSKEQAREIAKEHREEV